MMSQEGQEAVNMKQGKLVELVRPSNGEYNTLLKKRSYHHFLMVIIYWKHAYHH